MISNAHFQQSLADKALRQTRGNGLIPPFDFGLYTQARQGLDEQVRQWQRSGLPAFDFPRIFKRRAGEAALKSRLEKAQEDAAAAANDAAATDFLRCESAPAALALMAEKFDCHAVVDLEARRNADAQCQSDTEHPDASIDMSTDSSMACGSLGSVADMDQLDCEPHPCPVLPEATVCAPSPLAATPALAEQSASTLGKRHRPDTCEQSMLPAVDLPASKQRKGAELEAAWQRHEA